ncbi:hypothetical protein JXA34_00470 [Patescibacteria group bacterium]|nr:hypothetical protein [Patescibacteria group bacterium]
MHVSELYKAEVTNLDDKELIEKEQEVQQQKKRFFKIVKLFLLLVGLGIALVIAFYVVKELTRQREPPIIVDITPSEEENGGKEEPKKEMEWRVYKNDDLKVSFEYPKTAEIEEIDEENITKRVDIIYDVGEQGLEGYVFRVSAFSTNIRNLEEVAKIKLGSYQKRCPDSTIYSKITDTVIHDTPAKTFEVTNCDEDYKINYVYKFDTYYEFAQVYKGDLGFRQQYKMATEQMLHSIRFYPDSDSGPISPYTTYVSPEKYFQFVHPKLSQECCQITVPKSKNLKHVVNLYDKNTYVDKLKFDGVSIYQESINPQETTFEKYIETQKNTLIDDFVVVRGYKPETEEEKITIDDSNAYILNGYSWEGNIYIYIEMPALKDGQYNGILIFAIKNISGEEFEKTVNLMFDTLEFKNPK